MLVWPFLCALSLQSTEHWYGWKSVIFSRNVPHWLEHRISPIGFESDLAPAIIYSSALHWHERKGACWSQMLLSAFESAFTLFLFPSSALWLSSPLCSSFCLSVCLFVGFQTGFSRRTHCSFETRRISVNVCLCVLDMAALLKGTQNELQVF